MDINRDSLLIYLAENFGLDTTGIEDSTALFSDGLLDSFSVADLLIFMEEKGNFIVEPDEITYDNIDSIEKILAYAQRKCEAVS